MPPLAGDIMHSDRHLFLVYHHSTTIYLWDINGSGSITAKTSPISGSDVDNLAAVTIDQTTDAIYAVYCRGTPGTSELTYYKKSVDGGTTWGTETALQENASDNFLLFTGSAKEAWGGRVEAVWLDRDNNNFYTNYVLSVEIEAAAGSLARVTAIRHIYRPGSYRMEVTLGSMETSVPLPQQFSTELSNKPFTPTVIPQAPTGTTISPESLLSQATAVELNLAMTSDIVTSPTPMYTPFWSSVGQALSSFWNTLGKWSRSWWH